MRDTVFILVLCGVFLERMREQMEVERDEKNPRSKLERSDLMVELLLV